MPDHPTTFLDRFEELTPVGSGSMGTVYRAWDKETRTDVALKLLHNTGNPNTSGRFEREARILSQIQHPNMVRYVAHGMTAQGLPWLAMEWLEGVDLDTRLSDGVLGARDALRLARALAAGLSWAHDRGYVHRDLKPSNVIVPPSGLDHAKIVDFGLVRDVVTDDALTKTGMLVGTLEYMPPEQVSDAKRADSRADVYALGAVLYRCLTGHAPVKGNTLPEIVLNIVRGTIPPIASYRTDVPPAFADLVTTMLQKQADLRPASATLVAIALDSMDGRAAPVIDLDAKTELMPERPSFVTKAMAAAAALAVAPAIVEDPAGDSEPTRRRSPTGRNPQPSAGSFPLPAVPGLPVPPVQRPHAGFEDPSDLPTLQKEFPRRPDLVPLPPPPPFPATQRKRMVIMQWVTLGLLAVGVLALTIALLR